MKWMIIFLTLTILLIGCNRHQPNQLKFSQGDIVQWKGGGPTGIIVKYNSITEEYLVRFYQEESKSMNIGIGGSALINGGDGIKNAHGFFTEYFYEDELKLKN